MSVIPRVRKEWDAICAELGITCPSWIENEWAALLMAYCDGRRHYHWLGHIDSGLGMLNEYRHLAEDLLALKYAYVRHDEKYLAHPRPKEIPSNEAWSAAIADEALAEVNRQKLASRLITMDFRQRVVNLINVTHHSVRFPPKTPDEMLMADVDWSPMGSPWPEFLRHRRLIRAEYHQYDDKEFAVGRAGFIGGLRDRDSFFHLKEFKNRFDAQAKENIRLEIELLALPWHEQVAIMAEA